MGHTGPEVYLTVHCAAWFAITTHPNREKAVVKALCARGLEAYVPLYRVRRHWSDRVREHEVPLFPLYAFCRFDPTHRVPVLSTPGVRSIVGWGRTPIPVEEAELAAVRRIVASGLPVTPWPFLRAGNRILVEHGPLARAEGLVLQVKNRYRLIVSLTLLQRSVAVELDSDWVRPLAPLPPRHRTPAVCRPPAARTARAADDGRGAEYLILT